MVDIRRNLRLTYDRFIFVAFCAVRDSTYSVLLGRETHTGCSVLRYRPLKVNLCSRNYPNMYNKIQIIS